jgi:hypothetical protein
MKSFGVKVVSATIERMAGVVLNILFLFCRYIIPPKFSLLNDF